MTLVYQSTRDEKNRVTYCKRFCKAWQQTAALLRPLPIRRSHSTLPSSKTLLSGSSRWFCPCILDDFSEAELPLRGQPLTTAKFDDGKVKPPGRWMVWELFHWSLIIGLQDILFILPHLMHQPQPKSTAWKQNCYFDGDFWGYRQGGYGRFWWTFLGLRLSSFYPKDGVSKVQSYK